MFEKEAEEYIKEHTFFDEEYGVQSLDVVSKTIFKDGALFGYNKAFVEADKNLKAVVADFNKANEWHDLRKDPNDLPKKVGNYIVCYLDTACKRHTFELSFVDYFEDKHWIDEDNHNIEGYDEGVIAWCELPTFRS